jgi:hypothetical protein
MRIHAVSLFALLAFGAPANAQIDVAIIAAAGANPADCRFTDVQAYLIGTGVFGSVDLVDVVASTPSLATLQNYDALLTWSNVNYSDSVALGDLLADYVDAGGGVVVATYANSSTSVARYLRGRWQTGGYEIIPAAGGSTSSAATLGVVLDPLHPVMQGVNSFSASLSRPTSTALTPGSTLIAQWSDGKTLVAEGAIAGRIDLGLYPPSSNCSGTSWNVATDGATLVANALLYVAGGGGSSAAYCFGDGTGTLCPCGNPGATGRGCENGTNSGGGLLARLGTSSIGSADLVLSGSGLQPGQPGLYFQGNNAINGGLGILNGDGLRCAGGGIRRIQIRSADVNGSSSTTGNVAAIGAVNAGDVRRYQLWYRNPLNSPCGANFNLTNGIEITWAP